MSRTRLSDNKNRRGPLGHLDMFMAVDMRVGIKVDFRVLQRCFWNIARQVNEAQTEKGLLVAPCAMALLTWVLPSFRRKIRKVHVNSVIAHSGRSIAQKHRFGTDSNPETAADTLLVNGTDASVTRQRPG